MAFHPPASRQRQLAISARLHLTEDAVPSAAGTKSAWPQPVLEAPVIEAPVIEAPVLEAPVLESPVIEAPVIEAPVLEAPVIEAPVIEAPVIEAPVIEAPVIDITKLTKKALIAYAKDSGIELAEGASKTEILATLAATAPKA